MKAMKKETTKEIALIKEDVVEVQGKVSVQEVTIKNHTKAIDQNHTDIEYFKQNMATKKDIEGMQENILKQMEIYHRNDK